jgi:hypothetical protein
MLGGVGIELPSSSIGSGRKNNTELETPPIWRPPGEAVTIAGLTIREGMVYVGRAIGRSGEQNSSVIDLSLPIAATSTSADPLGYWPSYAGISPECRRRYLEWLASGKQHPDTDIGYVFIYFYGLERRLVLESPDRREVRALVTELHRLRSIYAGNGSFNGYSQRLLGVATYLLDPTGAEGALTEPDLLASTGQMPLALTAAIARKVSQQHPLGFNHACAILFGLQEFSQELRRVPERGRSAFLTVLRARFAKAFPDGFPVHSRKDSHLQVSYRGASAGLQVDLTARAGLEGLADPATLNWTKLTAFGVAVAQEIGPYAKALTYHPARASSLYGLLECPTELRGSVATQARSWLEALATPIAAVPFGALAGQAIGTTTAKWTMRHRQQIAEALAGVGYAMEPDPAEGAEHLEDGSLVQVFRCRGDTRSRAMSVASAASVLVTAVANTAEGANTAAADRWLSAVRARLALSSDQLTRLQAQLAWLATRGVTLAKAKRILGDATQEEREFCAWSATEAAGATGKLSKPQIALLEAIYNALNIPRRTLYATLHAEIGAAAIDAEEPVLVSAEVQDVLHPIPRPSTAPAVQPDPEDRLVRIRAETERVSALLADIFIEDEAPRQARDSVAEGRFAGLNSEHAALLARLLTQPDWPRADFDRAASEAGLMPGGAMETINEWSFDHYGDGLLEDGDPVAVNRALLPLDAEIVPAG